MSPDEELILTLALSERHQTIVEFYEPNDRFRFRTGCSKIPKTYPISPDRAAHSPTSSATLRQRRTERGITPR